MFFLPLPELSGYSTWITGLILNTVIALIGILSPQQALTRVGVLHAWILGVVIWGCWGWPGYTVVAVYFLVGTASTRLGKQVKEERGIAEKRGGARGPENVWGSAFTGFLCSLGYIALPHPLWWLAYTASFAAKLADTCSSEIGKAYGRRTFLITSFQPVPPGTEGAVSLEGTGAGAVAAAGLVLLTYTVSSPDLIRAWGLGWLAIGWLAAMLATTAESWIGSVLQPRLSWLTNEVVNGIQTTLAALIAALAGVLFLGLSQS
jgi:uncharacterized protein (TIGR00297 family)